MLNDLPIEATYRWITFFNVDWFGGQLKAAMPKRASSNDGAKRIIRELAALILKRRFKTHHSIL
jgi:phage-related holin